MYKVSVIIPVFNSSLYIERCCHSLFSQTMEHVQYIFVDDGSTDGSINKLVCTLNSYPNRIEHVSIIENQSNRGVSTAREKGLEHAEGEYVIQCDSDDWMDPEMLQLLYDCAVANEAEVVTCGHYVENEKDGSSYIVAALDVDPPISFSIAPQTGALWVKLIKHEVFLRHNLHFPHEINWGEDLCLSLQALLLSRKSVALEIPLYHYCQHLQSITSVITDSKCKELCRCGSVIEQFLKENDLHSFYSDQLNWLKFQLKQYYIIFPQVRDIRKWEQLFPESHSSIFEYPCTFYLKIASWLILHRMDSLALFLLKCRDCISTIKHKCI